jgi:hypothetical protein
LLAIVTEQGLNLSWLPAISQARVPKLKALFLAELLEQIKGRSDSELLRLKVEVK